jgi:hypothetical protein
LTASLLKPLIDTIEFSSELVFCPLANRFPLFNERRDLLSNARDVSTPGRGQPMERVNDADYALERRRKRTRAFQELSNGSCVKAVGGLGPTAPVCRDKVASVAIAAARSGT